MGSPVSNVRPDPDKVLVAIGLIFGRLTSAHYEDGVASDPRIDALLAKMICTESAQYTKDYLDPEKRSIANAIQIFFKDGSKTGKIEVKDHIGHRHRKEGIPVLVDKFKTNLARSFPVRQQKAILDVCQNQTKLEGTPVNEFVDMFVI